MSDHKYLLEKDSQQRWRADVAEGMAIAIKLLAADHHRRVVKGVLAFAILDISTSLGVFRIRDISIMKGREPNNKPFVRYRQWDTGRPSRVNADRNEWLDIAGPQDADSRRETESLIIEVYQQIQTQAADGTLGQALDPQNSPPAVGDNSETQQALENLHTRIDKAEGKTEGDVSEEDTSTAEETAEA